VRRTENYMIINSNKS